MKKIKFYIKTFLFVFTISILFSFRLALVTNLEEDLLFEQVDTILVDSLNEWAWQFRRNDPEKAKMFADSALMIAREIPYPKGLGDAHTRLGVIYKNQKDYDSSIYYYEQALEIRKGIEDEASIGGGYYNLAEAYRLAEKYDQAEKVFEEGLAFLEQVESIDDAKRIKSKIYDRLGLIANEKGQFYNAVNNINKGLDFKIELGLEKRIAGSYVSLGRLHRSQNHYQTSLSYFIKAQEIYKQENDLINLAKCYQAIGNTYFLQKKYTLALEAAEQSLQLKKANDQNQDLDTTYELIGGIYQEQGEYKKALAFFDKCLQMRQKNGNVLIANTYVNIGKTYLQLDRLRDALKQFLLAEPILEKQEKDVMLVEVYGNISDCYYELNEANQAFLYAQKQANLNEQIAKSYQKSIDLQMQLAEARVEKQKFALEKEKLELDQQVLLSEKKRQTWIIWSLVIASLLLFGLFIQRKRNNALKIKKVVAEQKEKMAVIRIDKILQQQEIKTIYARIEGEEMERKRIAIELHDGVGSILSSVKMHFKALKSTAKDFDGNLQNKFKKASSLLDDAAKEIRVISHKMDAGPIKENGLVHQLDKLTSHINDTGLIKTELFVHGLEQRLDTDIAKDIYRIIQELVSNVLKHAQANEMTIQINKVENTLNCIVSDDGVGFTKEVLHDPNRGIGLKNIIKRVKSMDGDIIIDSGKGGGSTISFDLPVKERQGQIESANIASNMFSTEKTEEV